MALAAGTRFGPYEITGQLGAGGMGEVYRATDTRLKREVAVKVLPAEVAADPDRLARFQREAEVLASLNHPNIAGIYGLEESPATGSGPAAGSKALVMELVEGPTLADRITGPMPPDDVLPIALQIAEALEAAHGQGIVHRDLKPANVKVRPDGAVKVLDFGLAKATTPGGGRGSGLSMAPTLTSPAMTVQGMVVGTAAYMSPEQARGRPVDRRTDVWAFGAVLFEMLTGTAPFPGDDVSQVMARVIERDPDWSLLPATTPPGLRQAVRICLRKDVRERAGDLSAVRLAMQGAFLTGDTAAMLDAAPGTSRGFGPLPIAAVALVLGLVVGAIGWSLTRPAPPALPVERFEVTTPVEGPIVVNSGLGKVAISPDGMRIAYASAAGPGNANLQIYVRGLDELEPTLLRGTEGGGTNPFFSPDGQSLGFVDLTENALKRVPVTGGLPQTIATFDDRVPFGMEWTTDDTILFALDRSSGLLRIPAGGGDVEQLTTLREGDRLHALSDVLPDGRQALLTVAKGETLWLGVADLASGAVTDLGLEGTDPEYSPTGHILYSAADTLFAIGFDAGSLALTTRTPVPVVENVLTGGGIATFGLSANGSLVYLQGSAAAAPRTLVWVRPDGSEAAIGVPPRLYDTPRVSPDGTRAAVAADGDIWVTELARPGTLRRITTEESRELYPLWTPDGERLIFGSNRSGAPGIYAIAADGRGEIQPVLTDADGPPGTNLLSPGGWMADGRLVFVYRSSGERTDLNVGTVALDGNGSWQPLLDTPANEATPVVSRDGQWIAYEADDTGQYEVYVERLPALGGRQIVSAGGARHPVWTPDGTALFFRRGTGGGGAIMVSRMGAGRVLTPEPAEELPFGASHYGMPGPRMFDVAPDGRFLMMNTVDIDESARARLVLVQNWLDELRRRVPVP